MNRRFFFFLSRVILSAEIALVYPKFGSNGRNMMVLLPHETSRKVQI